jgi:hypothetical protein
VETHDVGGECFLFKAALKFGCVAVAEGLGEEKTRRGW